MWRCPSSGWSTTWKLCWLELLVEEMARWYLLWLFWRSPLTYDRSPRRARWNDCAGIIDFSFRNDSVARASRPQKRSPAELDQDQHCLTRGRDEDGTAKANGRLSCCLVRATRRVAFESPKSPSSRVVRSFVLVACDAKGHHVQPPARRTSALYSTESIGLRMTNSTSDASWD